MGYPHTVFLLVIVDFLSILLVALGERSVFRELVYPSKN